MIVVLQRVTHASVKIAGAVKGSIKNGMLVLVGIEEADSPEDIAWLSAKIVNLRIFDDAQGVMNVNVKDAGGSILIVSQFTLHASTRKGNRPSYIRAAHPDIAVPLYRQFVAAVEQHLGAPVQTGTFGAAMQVELINDGPVTLIIDSKNRV